MPFKVRVADNFHYMDADETIDGGIHATAAEAIQEARAIVDECLANLLMEGMSAEDLYRSYTSFGEDPFIVLVGDVAGEKPVSFSAWTYAEARCRELCGGASASRSEPAPPLSPDQLGPVFEVGAPDTHPKSRIIWRGATMIERIVRFRRKPAADKTN